MLKRGFGGAVLWLKKTEKGVPRESRPTLCAQGTGAGVIDAGLGALARAALVLLPPTRAACAQGTSAGH